MKKGTFPLPLTCRKANLGKRSLCYANKAKPSEAIIS